MRYRVIYLSHSAEMGGAEYSLLELIRMLRETGDVAPVVATVGDGVFADTLRETQIEVVPLEIPIDARHFAREKASNPLALIQQFSHWQRPINQLKQWITDHPVDLLHSNTLKMHGVSSLVAKATQTPLVWHMRDIPSHRGNALRLLKGVSYLHPPDAVISISKAVEDSLQGLPGKRITQVIHNGLDIRRIPDSPESKAVLRNYFGLPPDVPIIVSVGYFIPWKGQDTLIQAFSKLLKTMPDAHLAFIGKPIFQFQAEQVRLEALASSLGVREQVHFLGEHPHVVEKLSAFDLFVCPSTREPFGRVILEAMAAQVPIVATSAGGIPEIVRDDQEALLVPPSDPEAMASAMARLFNDEVLRKMLIKNASYRLNQEFTLEKTAEEILRIYDKLGHDIYTVD